MSRFNKRVLSLLLASVVVILFGMFSLGRCYAHPSVRGDTVTRTELGERVSDYRNNNDSISIILRHKGNSRGPTFLVNPRVSLQSNKREVVYVIDTTRNNTTTLQVISKTTFDSTLINLYKMNLERRSKEAKAYLCIVVPSLLIILAILLFAKVDYSNINKLHIMIIIIIVAIIILSYYISVAISN